MKSDEYYYDILGLSPPVEIEDLKKAYRKLALQYHPDLHSDKKLPEKKMREINEAYSVLCKRLKEIAAEAEEVLDDNGNGPQIRPVWHEKTYKQEADDVRLYSWWERLGHNTLRKVRGFSRSIGYLQDFRDNRLTWFRDHVYFTVYMFFILWFSMALALPILSYYTKIDKKIIDFFTVPCCAVVPLFILLLVLFRRRM